jgi:hypothetical protein
MSWAAAATAAGSVASGFLSKKSGGGGAAMPQNITLGDATFGDKYIGTDAVRSAPSIADAKAGGVARWLPWVVAGVLGVVALVVVATRSRKEKR